MGVQDLKAAIGRQLSCRLAIVSEPLFHDLMVAGELATHVVQIDIPSDPAYRDPINALLKSMGVDPDAPASFIFYSLKTNPKIKVDLAVQHGLSLTTMGPGSYVLR